MASGERAGFLIGDGAGVGKGRTIAGIIFENFLQGRKKAIWVRYNDRLPTYNLCLKLDLFYLFLIVVFFSKT